ncbi:MAG: hypothetical protein J6Y54_05305, partial [Lentisphaeria bacterium]|nr:hypothetical protein [Lentisphaeria bacterium]
KTRLLASVEAESKYFSDILAKHSQEPNSLSVVMVLYNTALAESFDGIGDEKFVLNGSRNRQLWLKLNPEPKRPADRDQKKAEK